VARWRGGQYLRRPAGAPMMPTAHVVAAATAAQLVAQTAELLRQAAAVLQHRWRWLWLALLLAASVRFCTLAQERSVLSSQATGEQCMFVFMVFYLASLAFIASFDT